MANKSALTTSRGKHTEYQISAPGTTPTPDVQTPVSIDAVSGLEVGDLDILDFTLTGSNNESWLTDKDQFELINALDTPMQFSNVVPKTQPTNGLILSKNTSYLDRLEIPDILARENARLIVEALCAVPEQMLRRATFPCFIHPHWNCTEMPEALAICIRIAQMFASRTPEIAPFIWRTVLAEQRRAMDQVHFYHHHFLAYILF